jgi:tRNA (guanine37-N1)-methyltransferase
LKLREYLKGKLGNKELEQVPRSFDVVGDIAVFIDFPPELKRKEKFIAKELMKLHKNIKVVCKKVGKYSGKYRTSKLKIIGGESRKETIHLENGVRLMLDVEKVYFSPRSGTERGRIANLVRPKENVAVFFSGCGPFTCQIAKKAKHVTAIEANPIAHKYALKNLELNKIKNASVLKGDVKKFVPKLKDKFDRIIMPLPKSAISYLNEAFSVSKKGTIIHLYSFAKKDEFDDAKNEILSRCKKLHKKCRIIRVVKAGEYSPRTHRICIDFSVQ